MSRVNPDDVILFHSVPHVMIGGKKAYWFGDDAWFRVGYPDREDGYRFRSVGHEWHGLTKQEVWACYDPVLRTTKVRRERIPDPDYFDWLESSELAEVEATRWGFDSPTDPRFEGKPFKRQYVLLEDMPYVHLLQGPFMFNNAGLKVWSDSGLEVDEAELQRREERAIQRMNIGVPFRWDDEEIVWDWLTWENKKLGWILKDFVREMMEQCLIGKALQEDMGDDVLDLKVYRLRKPVREETYCYTSVGGRGLTVSEFRQRQLQRGGDPYFDPDWEDWLDVSGVKSEYVKHGFAVIGARVPGVESKVMVVSADKLSDPVAGEGADEVVGLRYKLGEVWAISDNDLPYVEEVPELPGIGDGERLTVDYAEEKDIGISMGVPGDTPGNIRVVAGVSGARLESPESELGTDELRRLSVHDTDKGSSSSRKGKKKGKGKGKKKHHR